MRASRRDTMPSVTSTSTTAERTTLIHREMLQLIALAVVAVAAFFVTRAVAMNNRELTLRNAAEWYRRGELFVNEGQIDDAVDAFRRATVRNRTNRTYVLALARTLAVKHDYDSARSILLAARESAPEDNEINLDLARVAAARHDVTEALRFYHDALYAPWPTDQAEQRRSVRLELIRFLLVDKQPTRAQSELLASAADMPDDAAHHIELAGLFAQAGDDGNALVHFQRALRAEPDDTNVLAGAATAAFHLSQYSLARRYLHQMPDDAAAARSIRETVDLVVSRDPMAARIGSRERHRRLDAVFSYAQQRFADCVAQRESAAVSTNELTLQNELQAFERRLQRAPTLDQDTIESGLGLLARVEHDVVNRCGPPTTEDQALLLIARQHGVEPQ
jgi:Tfp pilus assembly protein PilF